MSFFREFKDDLTQAVNELLPDNTSEQDEEDNQMVDTLKTEIEAEKYSLENERLMDYLEEFVRDDPMTEEELQTSELDDELEDELYELKGDENVMEDNLDLELLDALTEEEKVTKIEADKDMHKVRAASVSSDDEVTVITKGTVINGSISSDGSLEINGTITGDIECLGKLSITGKVSGNSSAAEVYVNTDRLEGCITSEGSVKVGLGTVIIGNINAASGVIAGAVKGEIDINGPIVIDSTAIIKGNIKAKSVQINNGAVIEGFCSLSYAQVDVENIFE